MLLENIVEPPQLENNLNEDLDYIAQTLNGSVGIKFQPFKKSTSSSSSIYNNPYKEKIVTPPRYSFNNKLKTTLEDERSDDDLIHSIDRLNNLRYIQEDERLYLNLR